MTAAHSIQGLFALKTFFSRLKPEKKTSGAIRQSKRRKLLKC